MKANHTQKRRSGTAKFDLKILYEDNHLLVVNKPAGVLSQSDGDGSPDLLTECKQYIKTKYCKPGEVYLALVHRLDRSVSGVMVFCRTSKAAARLSEQFQKHTTRKEYLAVVLGQPEKDEAECVDYLKKVEQLRKAQAASKEEKGAVEARLKYRVLGHTEFPRHGKVSLIQIELLTGRFHQIRFQMSVRGCPILGDRKYGAPGGLPQFQLALHALQLELDHPTTGKRMNFRADPPPGWPAGLDIQSILSS